MTEARPTKSSKTPMDRDGEGFDENEEGNDLNSSISPGAFEWRGDDASTQVSDAP